MATTTTLSTDDIRRLRRRARLTQANVANELGIGLRGYIGWETYGETLPWERTPLDVIEAIEALKARRKPL